MVASHTQWPDPSITHLVIKDGNILDTFFEAEATSEGHIADIGNLSNGARCQAPLMVIGPNPLDRTDRPRAELLRHSCQRLLKSRDLLIFCQVWVKESACHKPRPALNKPWCAWVAPEHGHCYHACRCVSLRTQG